MVGLGQLELVPHQAAAGALVLSHGGKSALANFGRSISKGVLTMAVQQQESSMVRGLMELPSLRLDRKT